MAGVRTHDDAAIPRLATPRRPRVTFFSCRRLERQLARPAHPESLYRDWRYPSGNEFLPRSAHTFSLLSLQSRKAEFYIAQSILLCLYTFDYQFSNINIESKLMLRKISIDSTVFCEIGEIEVATRSDRATKRRIVGLLESFGLRSETSRGRTFLRFI